MQEFYIGWHQPNNGISGCGEFGGGSGSNKYVDSNNPQAAINYAANIVKSWDN
jgi:hypothetical protein